MSEKEKWELKKEVKKLDLKIKDKEIDVIHEWGMTAIKIGLVFLIVVIVINKLFF